MVPVIRDADKKSVYELAQDLAELSLAAREGKLKADQLQGATFTISSLGGIGGTGIYAYRECAGSCDPRCIKIVDAAGLERYGI